MFKNHPIRHIIDMFPVETDATLQFSRYIYKPQSLFDERSIIDISASEISEEWLHNTILKLDENEELAFHSLVKIGKKHLHLPMIDFCCKINDITYAKKCIAKNIGIKLSEGMKYYDSGRSIHAYGSHILKPKEWQNFMGKLLLSNYPDSRNVVDSRWIGHRIIGGYASLRLSKNTSRYKKIPTIIPDDF